MFICQEKDFPEFNKQITLVLSKESKYDLFLYKARFLYTHIHTYIFLNVSIQILYVQMIKPLEMEFSMKKLRVPVKRTKWERRRQFVGPMAPGKSYETTVFYNLFTSYFSSQR